MRQTDNCKEKRKRFDHDFSPLHDSTFWSQNQFVNVYLKARNGKTDAGFKTYKKKEGTKMSIIV